MLASDSALTRDVVFDILSSPRRRYVIYYLQRVDEPIELTRLAEEVAAWENETTVEELTSQQRKRVYVSLYQTHVPKLDDANIVDYDQEAGTVQLAAGADAVETYLSDSGEEVPWHWYYLAVSLASGLLIVLTVFDVTGFAAIPDILVAVATVVAFAAVALAQYLRGRVSDTGPEELQER
jgi:hypothetical protein